MEAKREMTAAEQQAATKEKLDARKAASTEKFIELVRIDMQTHSQVLTVGEELLVRSIAGQFARVDIGTTEAVKGLVMCLVEMKDLRAQVQSLAESALETSKIMRAFVERLDQVEAAAKDIRRGGPCDVT